ncbi:MAG: hypothetical protein M0Z36_01005 [Thermaerobacter sp.]|nr:hypothetical protein [Thermaerobacter sp.]
MSEQENPAGTNGEGEANSVGQIMTVLDPGVKTRAKDQLKHPAPVAWDTAQTRADNAYRAQDMQALGRACGSWFAACKAVWHAGGE